MKSEAMRYGGQLLLLEIFIYTWTAKGVCVGLWRDIFLLLLLFPSLVFYLLLVDYTLLVGSLFKIDL